MSGSRWVAEFPMTMVLESPRDMIALARAVARTVARATARLGNAARAVAAGCAQYDALGGEPSSVLTVTGRIAHSGPTAVHVEPVSGPSRAGLRSEPGRPPGRPRP